MAESEGGKAGFDYYLERMQSVSLSTQPDVVVLVRILRFLQSQPGGVNREEFLGGVGQEQQLKQDALQRLELGGLVKINNDCKNCCLSHPPHHLNLPHHRQPQQLYRQQPHNHKDPPSRYRCPPLRLRLPQRSYSWPLKLAPSYLKSKVV
jgi:hypothetical protein